MSFDCTLLDENAKNGYGLFKRGTDQYIQSNQESLLSRDFSAVSESKKNEDMSFSFSKKVQNLDQSELK